MNAFTSSPYFEQRWSLVSNTAMVPLFSFPLLSQLHSVLWVGGASWLYTLTNSRLNKWEVDDGYEHQVFSWDVQKALTESIIDAIWVSANMQRHHFHHY